MDLTTYPTVYKYTVSINGTEQPQLEKTGSVLDGFTVILNGSPFNVPTLTLQQYLAMEPVNVQLRLDRLKLYLEVCDDLTEEYEHVFEFSCSPDAIYYDYDAGTSGSGQNGNTETLVDVTSKKNGLFTDWNIDPLHTLPPFIDAAKVSQAGVPSLKVTCLSDNDTNVVRSGSVKLYQIENVNNQLTVTVEQAEQVVVQQRKIEFELENNSNTTAAMLSLLLFDKSNPDINTDIPFKTGMGGAGVGDTVTGTPGKGTAVLLFSTDLSPIGWTLVVKFTFNDVGNGIPNAGGYFTLVTADGMFPTATTSDSQEFTITSDLLLYEGKYNLGMPV